MLYVSPWLHCFNKLVLFVSTFISSSWLCAVSRCVCDCALAPSQLHQCKDRSHHLATRNHLHLVGLNTHLYNTCTLRLEIFVFVKITPENVNFTNTYVLTNDVRHHKIPFTEVNFLWILPNVAKTLEIYTYMCYTVSTCILINIPIWCLILVFCGDTKLWLINGNTGPRRCLGVNAVTCVTAHA